MRKPGGYGMLTMPRDGVVNFDGLTKTFVCEGTMEVDSFTCFHCGSVEHVLAKADVNAVGFCRNCFHPICKRCSGLPCEPFEKKLEAAEARERTLRSYGM